MGSLKQRENFQPNLYLGRSAEEPAIHTFVSARYDASL
jgi:hypothetical protein